jgi:RNA polymerase sigma-70 factor, ECF subfamily
LQTDSEHNTTVNPEIEALLDRAKTGDTEAFGCLYDSYADRIYQYIYYRTSNVEDARDLTQEVFVKAWQALPRYKRTKTPFLGWLFTISHNRVIDYYRTRKDQVYLNTEIDMPASDSVNPELMAEARLTQQEIRRAILQLPEEQQQVVILSFIEGLEYREIASALNKSEGNIRVIMHRALKKLNSNLTRDKD